MSHLLDQSGLLSHRNELGGRDDAALRMDPAYEGLCTNWLLLCIYLHLVVQHELPLRNRLTTPLPEPAMPVDLLLHGILKEANKVAPRILAFLHGKFCLSLHNIVSQSMSAGRNL